jgi:hypothetical protein
MNKVVKINSGGAADSAKPVLKRKRGRKPKNEKTEYQLKPDQTKFFVDLSKDKESLNKVFKLLEASNLKDYGREITFKDLSLFGIDKISSKDIEKIQESSLSKRELLERAWIQFKIKNKQDLSFDDFLLKKVGV